MTKQLRFYLIVILTFYFSSNYVMGVESFKATRTSGINWYEGSMESAFKDAKKNNKLMFLFWTASWCPPCNQFKRKVLSDNKIKEVINESFLPVYLDGDDPEAQMWGDRLKATGYPCLLILDSTGKEKTRLSNGVSVNEFQRLLKIALKNNFAIKDIVSKKNINEDEWNILAHHDWVDSEDSYLKGMPVEKIKLLLSHLISKTPTKLKIVKNKLQIYYYKILLKDNSSSEKINEVMMYVDNNLKDSGLPESLFYDYLDVTYDAVSKIEPKSKTKLTDEKYTKILRKIYIIFKKLEMEQKITHRETLTYYDAFIEIEEMNKNFLNLFKWNNESLQQQILLKIKKIRVEISKNIYEHHAVIGNISSILKKLNMKSEAYKVLKEELSHSAYPYFLMSSLGMMDFDNKNYKSGLEWYKKAYEAASGGATKFSYGSVYVKSLIEYSPKDEKAIIEKGRLIYQNLLKNKDSFYGSNLYWLDSLNHQYKNWMKDNVKRKKKVINLGKSILPYCKKVTNDQKNKCQKYFTSLGS